MRGWDLARAAKLEKVGFWAEIAGYFFIFLARGGARAGRDAVPGALLHFLAFRS
jgi:hypothetical protein